MQNDNVYEIKPLKRNIIDQINSSLIELQEEINAIVASANVDDIVSDLTALNSIDITDLDNGYKVQVLRDSDHNNNSTLYKLDKSASPVWQYIGEYGTSSYTKEQIQQMLNLKQDLITISSKLSADLVDDTSTNNKFVSALEKELITTDHNAILGIKNGTSINNFRQVEESLALKQNKINANNPLSADLITDETTAHKFVTAEEKEQITTNKEDILKLKEEIEVDEVTYSELVALRNSEELHTNSYYLITDYVTTTNGKVNGVDGISRSAGHQFDLLVKAISNSELSEEANALIHSGDTYFANSDLSVWKIWYCLDNDTSRFEWADTVNGKGVIYRMIDEFDNDLPYDFKNIQFKRYKITATTDSRQNALVGMYLGFEESYGCTCDTSDFVWRYTFTKRSDDSELSYVASNNTSYTNSYFVKQVKIGQYLTDSPNYRGKQALNNIVFVTSNIVCDIQIGVNSFNNTLVGNTDITYSYYGEMFRKNVIIGEQSHNRMAECMQNNLLGDGTLSTTVAWNRAGDHFENNIGISFSSNNFETNAKNTRFASIFTHNNVDIVIASCDFSNLDEMSHCNIGTMIDCTISGYWYTACEFVVLSDITCDINAVINCTFNRAQYVSYTQGSVTINTMNLTFDAMTGNSASDMLIIDLSGAPNIASQFNKRVGLDKGEPTGKVLTYTYDKVNPSTLDVEYCKYAYINSVWTELSQFLSNTERQDLIDEIMEVFENE